MKQEKHTKYSTSKSQAMVYLLQCRICFIQYVGCNLSLHTFPKPESYISTRCEIYSYELITKIYNTIEEMRFILKKLESFSILNFRTLYPHGLAHELNDV